MAQIDLKLKEKSYPIVVCKNSTTQLVKLLKKEVKQNRLFVFYDANFYALHGKVLAKQLADKFQYHEIILPSGEKTKSEKELSKIYSYLHSEKISRTDFILAVGGGVTTDIVGYAAATTLRGIKWGAVPTTLLGMVDASIGGKTGINHKAGKNLIGAFWQPSFVFSNIRYLQTLPHSQIISGFGEIVKYAGLVGNEMFDKAVKYLKKDNLYDESLLYSMVVQASEYKSKIVKADERESGKRMLLNFGHTIGHAIEKSLGYGKLLHGEAVLLGIAAAIDLSIQTKYSSSKALTSYAELIINTVSYVPYKKLEPNKILDAMLSDKKRIDSKQKFILLKNIGKPIITESVSQSEIMKSIEQMLYLYKHGVNNV